MNTPQARRFLTDDQGLESVEWATIAGLIVASIIAVVLWIGPRVAREFAALRAEIAGGPAVVTSESDSR
jgi:Flp pilus assembly pilin Flp